MAVSQTGSFFASLADGEYLVAELPMLKEQWERGETPVRAPVAPPSAPPPTSDVQIVEVSVIVQGGMLVGLRVGDDEPISTFARSRDTEHKWFDT